MAKELQDWIIPWIDDHYNKHGTDTSRIYRDGKKVQIVEFETYRNHTDPNDKTQIVAIATDSVHRIRLVFDRGLTDRIYQEKGHPITRDLRCLYRLREYKILIPPYLFPVQTSTDSDSKQPPILDQTYRPKTRPNLFTILVTQSEWYWGSPSEPNFCSSPVDVRLSLLGPEGRISAYALGYRDKVMARLKRREKRSRSRERSVMSEQDVERMEVYEEYRRAKMGKNDDEVRRDAMAVLEILLEDARTSSINGQRQGMGVITETEGEEQGDDIEMDDAGSPISPKGNSYEAPPFQVPQPNFSLSHPTPPTSSGEAMGSIILTTPTPTKSSSRAQERGLDSSPTKAVSRSRRSAARRPEDDDDAEDPIVRLLQGSEAAAGSSSSPSSGQPDPMKVYELLVENQLAGRCVDWAFQPSDRWVGGEEGLKRVLEGVKVFGLDIPVDEGDDDDEKDEEVVTEEQGEEEDVAMREPEQPEEVKQSPPAQPSYESRTSSRSQNAGKMMRRQRRTRSRERERGRSSEIRSVNPSSAVSVSAAEAQHVQMQVDERERSPSLRWETSPEPDRPRLDKSANTIGDRTSVSMEAKEFAEVIDGMLTSQSDDEEEVNLKAEQARVEGGVSRQTSVDAGEMGKVQIQQQAGPRRRPNVQRISLGSPSSEEERPRASLPSKRKASVDSPFIRQPPLSERERSKRQKLEEIRRLQEEVEKLEAEVESSQVEVREGPLNTRSVERTRSMSVNSTRSTLPTQVKDVPPPTVEAATRPRQVEKIVPKAEMPIRDQAQPGPSPTPPPLKTSPEKRAVPKNTNVQIATTLQKTTPRKTTPRKTTPPKIPSKASLLFPADGLRLSEVHALQMELKTLLKGVVS